MNRILRVILPAALGLCLSGLACSSHRTSADGDSQRASSSDAQGAPAISFGEPLTLPQRRTLATDELLKDQDRYKGEVVRVTGTVVGVCESKGCWIELDVADSEEHVFVKFNCPVGDRLIPLEAMNKTAVVEGTFQITEIGEAEARHYAEDAGDSPEEIAKIVGPQKTIRIVGRGARIAGL